MNDCDVLVLRRSRKITKTASDTTHQMSKKSHSYRIIMTNLVDVAKLISDLK